MKTIRLSATQARNSFFTLLSQVIDGQIQVVIEKAGETKEAVLVAKEAKVLEAAKRLKTVEETYGLWKSIPASEFSDDRLRGKRARKLLETLRNA